MGSNIRLHSFPVDNRRGKEWENACEPKTASVPRAMPSTSFFRCIVFDGVLTVFFHKECKHPETE